MYKVIPVKGKKVIDPATMKTVGEKGIVIPKLTTYWKNRERDKDVKLEEVKVKQAPQKKEGDK